ncbi:MAG TPA: response regulator [Rhizomicrobium sp.]|nr:response regulator [Rhizomicrobium sp.]
MEEAGHHWPRKVRLINFEAFRDRLGPTWPKIGPKIELLAEKLIHDQMSEDDRCLAVGESEFLVFYAGASPEEIRIRCSAVVEAIQQKLFGVIDQPTAEGDYRFAEIHAPHDDLASVWEQASSAKQRSLGLRDSFHKEPERPDIADIAASAQTAIDSLIVCGMESGDLEQAGALRSRLNHLSDGVAFLNGSLLAGKGDGAPAGDILAPLEAAQADAAELRRIFDSGQSQAEIVEALAKLRKARAERAAPRGPGTASAGSRSYAAPQENFQYLPVLRSVSHGDQIYQGIFRVISQAFEGESNAASDLLVLEHALKFLASNKHPAHFPLMVPVHAETLRSPVLYRKYSTLVRAAAHVAKRLIVLEIVAGEDAADSIAMRRAIEELKANFLAIFVVFNYQRAGALENAAAELKKAGVHALGVEFSQAPESSAPGVLKKISAACRQNGLASYATEIRNFTIFAEAISAGIGYASAPVVRPAVAAPVIERTSFGRLYYVASRIGRPGRQVLIADDESMFRDAVAEFLKASGFEVFEAPDGEEALATLKKHPHIALLISDVRMPRMDGYSLVEASLELKPDLQVIMMTGYGIRPTQLVQDRKIDTLHKPFDLKVLGSRAQNLAAVHRTAMLD